MATITSQSVLKASGSCVTSDPKDHAGNVGVRVTPQRPFNEAYVKCRREGRVLGVDVVDTEPYGSWLAFLRAIRSRGAGSRQLRRRVGRIVSQVFRGRDAATVTGMYHAACGMLEGCCPRAAAVLEEAEPDALAYLDFPPTHWKRLRTDNVQERTNREMRRRPRVVQVFPSTGSLARLAGAVMCEQDEMWQESRHLSGARMSEPCDDGRTRGIGGPVEWARLEAEAGKMPESGLELADRVEAA